VVVQSQTVLGTRRAQSWFLRAVNNTSFTDTSLCRGTGYTSVLRQFALILGPQPCTAAYYDLSNEVNHIASFISHNWSMSRLDHFLIMSLHFNFFHALCTTAVIMVMIVSLASVGYLPVLTFAKDTALRHGFWSDGQLVEGVWCSVLGPLVFALTINLVHDILSLSGVKGRTLFLDKTCVHQMDESLKVKGIEHLAAFQYYSWSMLICYSDVYFEKLWTVYEVATFLMLHPGASPDVRPVDFSFIVWWGLGLNCAFMWSYFVLHTTAVHQTLELLEAAYISDIVTLGIGFPAWIALAFALRRWAKRQASMDAKLKSFRISDAKCFAEADRITVTKNIIAFMKHQRRVDPMASDAVALQEFEGMVHNDVPPLFQASLGHVGIPYRYLLVMFIPYAGSIVDVLCGLIFNTRASWRICVLYFLLEGSMCCAVLPLNTALSMWICRRSLAWRMNCTVFASIHIVQAISIFVVWLLFRILSDRAEGSDVVFAIFIIVVMLLFCCTFRLYQRKPEVVYRRTLGAQDAH